MIFAGYNKSQEKYVYSSSTINAIGIFSHKNTFDNSSVFTFIPSGSGYLIQDLFGNFINLIPVISGRFPYVILTYIDQLQLCGVLFNSILIYNSYIL
jgi:hypothetical protein